MKTNAANAAAWIRTELKKAYPGLKFTCRSETYSGGNSVRVTYTDQPAEKHKAIEALLAKYEYGHFNGMDDIYEYSNRREDVPQVKYLFVTNEMSDEKRQELYDTLRKNWAGGDQLPEKYIDGRNMNFQGEWVSTWVHRGFTGAQQL